MPLSCLDQCNAKIQAFDLNNEQWEALKAQNSHPTLLRMPCCGSDVVLKKSMRGTRFFAHKKVGYCLSGAESEEHRHLKALAVKVARSCGWQAETEVSGVSLLGEPWQADVLAIKGNKKVAIEVQWSRQAIDDILRRQQRYTESGVRGLWLLRHPAFPVIEELPAACIGGTVDEGFHALLPYQRTRMTQNDRLNLLGWKAVLPMHAFLSAAFDRRLRWGRIFEIAANAEVEVFVAEADCVKCGVVTDIIVGLVITIAGERIDLSLLDLTQYTSLKRELCERLPSSFNQSYLKIRYSHTRKESYLSNGCSGCDQLYGDFFLAEYRNGAKVVCRFPIRLTDDWLKLVQESADWKDYQPEWWLLPRQD
jgi:competence protein CoiA